MSQANLIVVFVVDTSESMATRTSDGRSLMDHAKDVVEQMTVKNRHTPTHHVLLTNCLLLTTEDWPANVKTSWSDWGDKPEKRMARFQEQLKKLEPSGNNAIAPALGKAFDLLGQHRLRTGVDCWGKGRSPWCSEPGAVVLISDGKNASAGAEDYDEPRSLDMNTVTAWASGAIGSDLCGKPFRWDQRLFALVLGGGSGGDGVEVTAGGDSGGLGWDALETLAALECMCQETGGCLMIWDGEDTSKRKSLANHVNDLIGFVYKKAPVVMFRSKDSICGAGDGDDLDDLDGFDGFNSPQLQDVKKPPAARAGIILRGGSGIWPIPEPFWVDRSVDSLPPRPEAQPEIMFRKPDLIGVTENASPAELLEQLGVGADKYELEWCGEGSRLDVPRSVTWQLLVKESGPTPGAGKPFGYLRASQSSGKTVMVLLPYNYEELIPLLQLRASTVQATKSPQPPASGSPWARDFVAYLKGVPTYYLPALQRVLQPFGVISLIPGDSVQGGIHHRKVVERLNNLKDLAGRHVERADRIERAGRAQDPDHRQHQQQDSAGSVGGTGPCSSKPSYSNAFQVPIGELLSQWENMRSQLFGSGGATVNGLFGGAPGPNRLPPTTSTKKPRSNSLKSDPAKDEDEIRGAPRGRGVAKEAWAGRAGLRSPVLGCVALSLAPARSTQEMSDFMTRMQGVEYPRDPLSDPGPDENMPQGGFQRLMAKTTFESPFAKKKTGLSPLGLDEAANESAILEIDLGNEGEKKNGDHKAGDSVSPDTERDLDTANNAKTASQEDKVASSGDSSASQPSTTPVQSCSSPTPSSQGPNGGNGGLKRSPSVSRKQLPKLVAVRGRRRMRPDANFNPMPVTGKSSVPPPVPPSTNGINGTGGANSSSSSNGGTVEGGSFLFPPSSPALAAPRTPDYSPPPSPSPYVGTDERGALDVMNKSRASKTPRISSVFPDRNGGSGNAGMASGGDRPAVRDDGVSLINDKNTSTRGEGNGGGSAAAAATERQRSPAAPPKLRHPQPPVKPRPPATPRPPPPSTPRPYSGKGKGTAVNAPTAPASPATSGKGTMFAPSSSPATFTPTASPARFAPTASPATRPGVFSLTSSPASKGASPTAAGQPRFTPTASPANFASRSGNGGFETDRRGQRQTAEASTERTNNDAGMMGARGAGDDGRSRKRDRDDREVHKSQEPPALLRPQDYILPDGWILAFSKREQRDYYFNHKDKTTQWHPPVGSRPR